jgi:hypothetical protein
MPRKSPQHKACHDDANDRFARVGVKLVVLTEAAPATQPAEGALDDPALRQHAEAVRLIRAFDDLQLNAASVAQSSDPREKLAGVASIGPDTAQAQERVREHAKQQLRAIAILDIGGVNDDGDQQPERVDEQVPLASTDFLARIVTARPPFSVVFTDWLSMTPAVGNSSRPSARRSSPRSLSWMERHVPSFFHALKYLNVRFHGGKSCGISRHAQPLRTTYRMPFTISRRSYSHGRPPFGVPDCTAGTSFEM